MVNTAQLINNDDFNNTYWHLIICSGTDQSEKCIQYNDQLEDNKLCITKNNICCASQMYLENSLSLKTIY